MATEYIEDALIAFRDDIGKLYVYNIDVGIQEQNQEIMTCPSLLGRDIMSRWSFSYDFPNRSLSAAVDIADWIFDTAPNTMPYLSCTAPAAPVMP